jgi:hypothetical protein
MTEFDILIKNSTVYDGSMAEPFAPDLLVNAFFATHPLIP